MIQTYTDPGHPTTIIHEVRGSVDRAQAEQGAKESLLAVQQAHAAHGTLRLLIDLRGMHYVDLPAHRAWSVGFARNPKLNEYVSHAAIVGTDTQQFRVEQEQMSNARVGFFKDIPLAMQWLAGAASTLQAGEPPQHGDRGE